MLQNPCKKLGYKKNMVFEIPPSGEVNHIQPVAYLFLVCRYTKQFLVASLVTDNEKQ